MTIQEVIDKYLGTKVDVDGAYGAQCVDWVRKFCEEMGWPQLPRIRGAADWWDRDDIPDFYKKIPNTPEALPKKGAILVWNKRMGGGFGHTGIFYSGDLNSFISVDQNYPTGSPVKKVHHKYTSLYGWFQPKEEAMSDDALKACLEDRKKFWKERDEARAELEACKTQAAGYQSRATDLSNQLGEAQAEVKNREEQVSRLKDQLITTQANLESTDTQLKNKQKELNEMAKEKGTLAIEAQQLKTQLETAKAQGKFTITIGDLFSLLWNQKITIERKS